MTKDRSAKSDARARKEATGEKYTQARRTTAKRKRTPPDPPSDRLFVPDSCANCFKPLPYQVDALYCSDLCKDIAEAVRYWRRITRDGRDRDPDVRIAVQTQIAHLLAGGYHETARRLSPAALQHIWKRDQGRCVQCGKPGAEIDHMDGDSDDPANLQLLCAACHHTKTAQRMVPADVEQVDWVTSLRDTRVTPDTPALLCDDQDRWKVVCPGLKKERRQRLLGELTNLGHKRRDFPYTTWAQMWDHLLEGTPLPETPARRVEVEEDDVSFAEYLAEAWSDGGGEWGDDDSGYGRYSYFAHAMAKDD